MLKSVALIFANHKGTVVIGTSFSWNNGTFDKPRFFRLTHCQWSVVFFVIRTMHAMFLPGMPKNTSIVINLLWTKC